MNKKLSTLLIAAALLALMVPAFAQNSGPRTGGQGQAGRQQGGPGGQQGRMMWGRMGEQAVEKALTKVGATADQKKKVKALNEANAKARTTFMEKELKIKMPTPPKPGTTPPAQQQRVQLTDAQRTKLREFSQKQMTSTNAEMKKILGAKYDPFTKALQAEMQAMRPAGGRPGQGGTAAGAAGAGKKPGSK